MSPQRAKSLLPVIQEFANGKTIQHRPTGHDDWKDLSLGYSCSFEATGDYRVKPELREFWLYYRETTRDGKHLYEAYEHPIGSACTMHVREVEP